MPCRRFAAAQAFSEPRKRQEDLLSSAVRVGGFFLIYVVVGLLVAGRIIGNEDSYFSSLNNLEEIIEMVLAVLLWPLLLLDVNVNIGASTSAAATRAEETRAAAEGQAVEAAEAAEAAETAASNRRR